jgi:hypothetical protein
MLEMSLEKGTEGNKNEYVKLWKGNEKGSRSRWRKKGMSRNGVVVI